MKRVFDIIFASVGIILFSPFFFLIAMVIKIDSRGPVLFKQKRVGKNNVHFNIYKFRTMKVGTPNLATNLIDHNNYITKIGAYLRKTSLDEMPQLFNVLIGNMSFVGPRPALFNQDDLIMSRTIKGIHKIPPGITGWAQINGRDNINDDEKVMLDEYYLLNNCMNLDLRIILHTFTDVFKAKGIKA